MKGQNNKHVSYFKSNKLKPGEKIEVHLEGWVGDMMGRGKNTQRNGHFIVTNERVCFYRKGWIGEVFEAIPLSKITAIDTLSRLGYRVIHLHTSHSELAFKTFEAKDLFDRTYGVIEKSRHDAPGAIPVTQKQTESVTDQLMSLGKLRDAGILDENEFISKKKELLARL